MKAALLVVVVLVVCIVLFIVGVFAPRRSRRMQQAVDRFSKKGEGKGDRNAGKLGDLTRDALEKSRAAADRSARAGRRVNEKLTSDEE